MISISSYYLRALCLIYGFKDRIGGETRFASGSQFNLVLAGFDWLLGFFQTGQVSDS